MVVDFLLKMRATLPTHEDNKFGGSPLFFLLQTTLFFRDPSPAGGAVESYSRPDGDPSGRVERIRRLLQEKVGVPINGNYMELFRGELEQEHAKQLEKLAKNITQRHKAEKNRLVVVFYIFETDIWTK